MCGPHRGSSTVVHSVACGLGEHSATLKIALTVVQHGISLLLNRDLISQEGLLRSGVCGQWPRTEWAGDQDMAKPSLLLQLPSSGAASSRNFSQENQ